MKIVTLIYAYLKQLIQNNIFLSAMLGYMIFSILLLAATGIDVSIPCLWTTLFGHSCYGCGLTRAAVKLVLLDISGAYHFNPLIFIILPGIISYFVWDFIRYQKSQV